MTLANGKVAVCLEVSLCPRWAGNLRRLIAVLDDDGYLHPNNPFSIRSIQADHNKQGGYNFRSISKSALAVTRTLMGEPPDRLLPTSATQSAIDTVQYVKRIQSKYWRSMFPKGNWYPSKNDSEIACLIIKHLDPVDGLVGGDRLHGICFLLPINFFLTFNRHHSRMASYEALPRLQINQRPHLPGRNLEILQRPGALNVRNDCNESFTRLTHV